MPTATYKALVSWDGSGLFTGPNDDITGYVQEIFWERGRDYPSQLTGRSKSLSLAVMLNNETGRFNSFQSGSPMAGNILPRRPVRIDMTIGANTVTRCYGFLDDIEPQIALGGAHKALLRSVGPLALMNDVEVSLPVAKDALTGAAFGTVLDQAGWAAGDRLLDAGQTQMTRWPDYTGRVLALTAIRDLEDTEPGFVRETMDGKIAWEDRHHRLNAPHRTSQATFSDTEGSALGFRNIQQKDQLKEIFNEVRASVQTYRQEAEQLLWTLQSVPSIGVGKSEPFFAEWPNPTTGQDGHQVDLWTTPVATTDYTANSQADGLGTDLTADMAVTVSKFSTAMKITVTNNASQTAFLTKLQARGVPVFKQEPIPVESEDATSKSKYGPRTYPVPGRFIPDRATAQDYVAHIKSIYKDPIPILPFSYIANRNDDLLAKAQVLDVSDRITVNADAATKLGIGEDFFIESERHHITMAGMLHQVFYEVSPASGYSGFWSFPAHMGIETKFAY